MQVAQGLYEGVEIGGDATGLITYMRTDGITMVPEALNEAREVIGKKYGARYVPASARVYASKAKNAQEAHEAVRPTSFARTPEEVARYIDGDAAKLYELIWKRAVASQMESAPSRNAPPWMWSPPTRRSSCAPPAPSLCSTDFSPSIWKARTTSRTKTARGCPRSPPATRPRSKTSIRRSISPSRRRAIPKPAWSRSWKSWASAAPPPMPRSFRPCATAPM